MSRAGDAAYRLLLRVFPAAFRRRHGEAMAAQFRAQRDALAGRPAALCALWVRATGDAIAHGLASRLDRRRASRGGLMTALRQDLWHTWRTLWRRPGAALAIVLVLAIGIGFTSTIFALADPFLLRPLPYAEPDRLAVISLESENRKPGPFPTLSDFRARRDLFVGVAAYTPVDVERVRVRLPERDALLTTAMVDASFFEVLGVPIALPPGWGAAAGGGDVPIVLLSDADVRLRERPPGTGLETQDGRVLRIAGRLPDSFLFPRDHVSPRLGAIAPLADGPLLDVEITSGGFSSRSRDVVARLAAGVTPAMVESVLSPPESPDRAYSLHAQSLESYLTDRLRPLALGALAAALLIVLVCAANVAHLLIARSAFRARELATRAALGASRANLMRLVLSEIAMLTALGVAGGLACAAIALSVAGGIAPAEYLALGAPAVTGRVAGFAAALGVIVMAAGVLPAAAAGRLPGASVLAQPSVADRRTSGALRFLLAAGQSAVTMILIAGAALLGRSFLNLTGQPTGFSGDAVVLSVSYPAGHTREPLQRDIETTIARLRQIPGVSTAAATSGAMVDGSLAGTFMSANGRELLVQLKTVTPAYFDAVGSAILAGRPLADNDRPFGEIVVNARAAALWPDGRAVGHVVRRGSTSAVIIGVVADTFDRALDIRPEPTMFTLLRAPASSSRINFVVRSTQSLEAVRGPAERAITAVNRDAIVTDVSAIGDRLSNSVRDRSFATLVLGLFAAAGIGVCASGLIGLVAFVVVRRTREIAIRTALGAQPRDVSRLVMRQAVTAALAGAALGLVAGWWLSRSMETLLYGIEPGDPLTLAAGAVLMLTVVAITTWVPARRAVRLSPTIALRVE